MRGIGAWFKRQTGARQTGIVVGCLLGLFVIAGAIAGDSGESEPIKPTTAAAAAPVEVETTGAEPTTEEPAARPKPRPKPKPEPRTPQERIRAKIKALSLEGSGRLRIDMVGPDNWLEVTVSHEMPENFTSGMTRGGTERDAQAIFEALYTGPDAKRVGLATVNATSRLMDDLGNESYGPAHSVELLGETGRKVNWANAASIDFDKVWVVTLDVIG